MKLCEIGYAKAMLDISLRKCLDCKYYGEYYEDGITERHYPICKRTYYEMEISKDFCCKYWQPKETEGK